MHDGAEAAGAPAHGADSVAAPLRRYRHRKVAQQPPATAEPVGSTALFVFAIRYEVRIEGTDEFQPPKRQPSMRCPQNLPMTIPRQREFKFFENRQMPLPNNSGCCPAEVASGCGGTKMARDVCHHAKRARRVIAGVERPCAPVVFGDYAGHVSARHAREGYLRWRDVDRGGLPI